MQTLTIGAAQYTLAPTRNVGELQAKIAKCTGKHKPAKIAKPRLNYPKFKPGMSTAEYVALYDGANRSHYVAGYFAPLNTAPCALYDGADTHEELTDAELSQDAAPIECEPVPDVAAEVAAPIADPVSCADDVAELTARLLAAVARPKIAPTIAAHATPATHSEPAPVPGKSEPETLMLSHVLGALQCIAPDGIPDAAMLAREADRIAATAERMRDAMPDYSATCATAARDLRALADSAIDPLPGDTKPEALDDDETIPAPLDGLDVAELGDDGMAEFEQATREQATAPAYRELTTAHYRPQGPCLRIPAYDARAMIPQRFAPSYLLQA